MVILLRQLDLAVQSTIVVHWISGVVQRNSTGMSFVALGRLSGEDIPDGPGSTGNADKALVSSRSREGHTQGVKASGEKFQSVRKPRHQLHNRFSTSIGTSHPDVVKLVPPSATTPSNSTSSRRGKEQINSRASGSDMDTHNKLRDRRVDENPLNEGDANGIGPVGSFY